MSKHEHRYRQDGESRNEYHERRRQQRRERRQHHGHGWCGNIFHRVLDKSREVSGLPRGMVIAGYVLGFIFVPLLTTLLFLGMLYWSSFPDDARRNVDRVSRHARRAAQKMGAGMGPAAGPRPATGPDMDDLDFEEVAEEAPPRPRQSASHEARDSRESGRGQRGNDTRTPEELRARFEKLEQRARAIEAFVASEEYRLQREFDKMDDEPRGAPSDPRR